MSRIIEFSKCFVVLLVVLFVQLSSGATSSPSVSTDEFAGWRLVDDLNLLSNFFGSVDDAKGTINSTNTRYLIFKGNRRSGPNSYTHAYIGGTDSTHVIEMARPAKSQQVMFNINSEGKTTFRNGLTEKYWGFDATKTNKIIYVDKPDQALVLQMYINEESNAIFLKASNGQYVSIDLSTPVYLRYPDIHGLTLSPTLLADGGIFLSHKISSQNDLKKPLNKYIIDYRLSALQAGSEISSAWLSYDLALAVLLEKQFHQFGLNIKLNDQFLSQVLYTMFHSMVLYIPWYNKSYPSFGKDLPGEIRLNDFVYAMNLDATTVINAIIKLHNIIFEEVKESSDRQEWVWKKLYYFIRAVIAQTSLRDIEDNAFLFTTKETPLDVPMFDYYVSSCRLANMMNGATFSQKVNATQILYPRGSLDPYIGKNKEGRYWFSPFVKLDVTSLDAYEILPELGLLKYLPMDFVVKNTMVGDGISTLITKQVTELVSTNDIKGLALYARHQVFQAVAEVSSKVCKGSVQLKFCIVPRIMSQISAIEVADRSLINTNVTTSLLPGNDMDLQSFMGRLYDERLRKEVIDVLTTKQNDLMEFLKQSMDKTADDIESASLETMIINSKFICETQENLGIHLETSANFDRDSRLAQYDLKTRIMDSYIQTAQTQLDPMLKNAYTIANRALGEQAADLVVDLLETGVSAVATYFNPLGAGGLLTDTHRLTKSMTNMIQTTQLKKYVDAFAMKRMDEIMSKFIQYGEEIQKVNVAAKLMLTNNQLDQAKLEKYAANFIAVYGAFRQPVTESEVDEINGLWTELLEAFCEIMAIDGYALCFTIFGELTNVYASLTQALYNGDDALFALFQVASASVNSQSAMQMQENARNQLKETEESQRQLESNWDNDKQKKQTWWNEWRKKQSYTDALSKIGLIMNQALLFNTIVAFCNVNAYQNGGIPDQTCARTVFSGQPIAYEDIEVLINFKNTATMPQRISINAVIPTHPQYRGDKGFIDIGKIMSGEKVKFQLPVNNQTWLDQFNWLPGISSELETSVLYVKSFNLYLPPRYSTFMTKQTDVTVNVDFGGISSYGLALKGKRFAIPPLTFVTKYEQRPKDEVFFCEHVNLPNYDCNSFMPIVCATNYEIEEDELSPSLFSTFDVSASFDNGGSGSPIKYSNVTSTMYLSARLTVDLYQNVQPLETQESSMNGAIRKLEKIENRLDENTSKKDANKQSSQPRQRLRALEEIQRCCEVGFYRDWNTGKCIACPVGSISQIGGLYCVGLEKLTLITNNTVLADQ